MNKIKFIVVLCILFLGLIFQAQQSLGLEFGVHQQRLEDFERGPAFYNHKLGLNQAQIFKVKLDYTIRNPFNGSHGLICGALIEWDRRRSLEVIGDASYLGAGVFVGVKTGKRGGFVRRVSFVDHFILNDSDYYYAHEKASSSVVFVRASLGGYKRFKDKLEGGILINYQRDLSSRYSYVYQPHVPGLNSKYIAFAQEIYLSFSLRFSVK